VGEVSTLLCTHTYTEKEWVYSGRLDIDFCRWRSVIIIVLTLDGFYPHPVTPLFFFSSRFPIWKSSVIYYVARLTHANTGDRRKTKSRRADKKKTTYKRRILISLAHEENLKGKLDDGVMWTVLNGDPDISVCPPNSFHLSTSCDLLCCDRVKYIGRDPYRQPLYRSIFIHYTKLILIARKEKAFKREYFKFFFLCDVMGLFVVILFSSLPFASASDSSLSISILLIRLFHFYRFMGLLCIDWRSYNAHTSIASLDRFDLFGDRTEPNSSKYIISVFLLLLFRFFPLLLAFLFSFFFPPQIYLFLVFKTVLVYLLVLFCRWLTNSLFSLYRRSQLPS
jgi:hypothetical protein